VNLTPQKADEIRICLQHDEHRISPHPAKNLGGKGADPGSVFHEDARARPIYFAQYFVD